MPSPPGLTRRHAEIVSLYDKLPPSALLPVPVVSVLLGMSPRLVRKLFPQIRLSEARVAIRKSDVLVYLTRVA